MAASRHYPKAPITEAIIDLKVELPSTATLDHLKAVNEGFKQAYPIVKPRELVHGQIEFGQGLKTSASTKKIGFAFCSADGRQIYQARLDGFTMSRLAPYESWELFRCEARRLWEAYRSSTRPVRIKRLAVRYVNRLDLPLPFSDFNEYLRTIPELSPDLSQRLSGFFMHLESPQEDLNSLALINETIVGAPGPDIVSVVLDIDVFRDRDVPSSEDAIWSFFEQLRVRKNEIFEACITEKARRLFQ